MSSGSRRDIFVFLLPLLCAFLFFHPILISDKTIFFRDIHRLFYPMKHFLASSLQNGEWPFWCSGYFCGAPFMSDIQSGLFYPLSLVFLLFPYPWSLNLYVALHFILGFLFFYLFIRGLDLCRESALLCGTSFCYGGYVISSVNTLNNLSTAIWLPAILWACQRTSLHKGIRPILWAILVFSAAILGGEPQLLLLGTVLVFLCGLFLVPRPFSWRETAWRGTTVLLIVFSAVLLTGVQLLSTFQDYQFSARLGGLSFEEATRFSLPWAMLKHLLWPLPFHGDFVHDPGALKGFFPGSGQVPWLLTVYPGILVAPLAVLGLFLKFSRQTLFWLFILLLSLAFAVGRNAPVYEMFYALFPFFRFPEKFMLPVAVSLLVLAAYGFHGLLEFLKRKGVRVSALSRLVILLLLMDLYWTHRGLNPFCPSSFYAVQEPSLQPMLADEDLFRVYVDPEAEPPDSFETIGRHHLQWQRMLMPNLGILRGLQHVGGQSGLELRYQYFITELLAKPWKERIRFLSLANVKYIVSTQPLDTFPELREEVAKVSGLLYRIREPLPRAWMVGKLQPVRAGTLEELVDGSVDFSTTALTRGDVVSRHWDAFLGEVPRPVYGNGTVRLEIDVERSAILVLSEAAYPGWRALLDGVEVKCLWLNLLFQGVELEPGRHRVEFVFTPPHFRISLTVSLLSLLTILFLLLTTITPRQRKGVPREIAAPGRRGQETNLMTTS
ncbi:MAG: YfhO family protein [Deltaproteobacteria bacterium]|nr:YfhO family protein [Deltaproteobacteria bacterium]